MGGRVGAGPQEDRMPTLELVWAEMWQVREPCGAPASGAGLPGARRAEGRRRPWTAAPILHRRSSMITASIDRPRLEVARPSSVTAPLNFLAADSPKPVSYTFEPPQGTPWRTGKYEAQLIQIRDAR